MGGACPGAVRAWTAGSSPHCPLTERPCAPAVHWPWLSPGGSPSCENRSPGWEAGVARGLCGTAHAGRDLQPLSSFSCQKGELLAYRALCSRGGWKEW